MEVELKQENDFFYRITAIWAASECFLGGFLHAIKIPVSGLFLASLSVVYCALLAKKCGAKSILKALVIVLVIKAALSPHSPLGAYIAVGFQGLMAAIILNSTRFFRLKLLLLGPLVLLQSAFQKLIMLTIIYGVSFWQAVDEFLVYVVYKFAFIETLSGEAIYITLAIYLGIYAAMGLIAAFWAYNISKKTSEIALKNNEETRPIETLVKNKPSKKPKIWAFPLLSLLLITFLYDRYIMELAFLQIDLLSMMLRAIIILGIWYLIVGPLLLLFLKRTLNKKSSQFSKEIEQTMLILPNIKRDIVSLWQELSDFGSIKRVFLLVKKLPEVLLFNSQSK